MGDGENKIVTIHIYNAIMKDVKINKSFSDLKNIIDRQLELNNKAIEDYSNILIYYINNLNKNIFINNQEDFDRYFNYNDLNKKDLYIQSKGNTGSYHKRPRKFKDKIERILENETNKILNNINKVLLNKNKDEQNQDGKGNKCSRCQNIIKGKIFKSLINENEYYCNKCSNFHSYPLLIIN